MLRIKELREKKRIMQKDMAKSIGVGVSTLSQYETGKREPDYATLVKIAQYFNVSVDYLLNQDEKKSSAGTEDNINMDYKKFYDKIKKLSPEGMKKAEEYLEMLKTLEYLEGKNKKAQ